MRILHFLKAIRFEDGGVVRAVLDMAKYQARAGADVTLATCDTKDVPPEWKTPGPGVPKVQVIAPPSKIAMFDSAYAARVRPLVQNCDVMHLHVIWDPSQEPFARLGRELGKPYVQSPHGMLADWSVLQKRFRKSVYMATTARKMIDGASFIVTTAQAELDQSQKRHPKVPGAVIPLVFDLDPYRTLSTPAPARKGLPLPSTELPSLLYLSRLHYKKRPDLLLAAGRALRDMHGGGAAKFNIVIGGPCDETYDRQMRDYAKEIKVDDITTFLGMVPAALKPSLYEACDLFVLPTSMENFGFVYFESLASSTPLVTTKGTDTWKELTDSGGGRIVEMIKSPVKDGQVGGGDVRELAECINSLIANRPQLKPMGQRGRQWVLDNLEPSIVVAKYLAMYDQAIRGKRSA